MSYRVFRWVAGTFLIVVIGFIGVLALLNAGDSTDSGGAAVTTSDTAIASATTTTRPATTTTMATTTTRGVRYLTLPEALAAGMVEAEFRGTGSASGDIVTMAIRLVEAVDEIVNLSVPPGMMLTNTAGGEQDLVIRGLTGLMTGESTYRSVTDITLHDVEWREYILEAYCAEAHDDNPAADGLLTASESSNEDLAKVFAAVDELAIDDLQVIQAAVWAVTDNIRASELEAVGYGLDDTRLAQAREIIAAAGLDPSAFRLFG